MHNFPCNHSGQQTSCLSNTRWTTSCRLALRMLLMLRMLRMCERNKCCRGRKESGPHETDQPWSPGRITVETLRDSAGDRWLAEALEPNISNWGGVPSQWDPSKRSSCSQSARNLLNISQAICSWKNFACIICGLLISSQVDLSISSRGFIWNCGRLLLRGWGLAALTFPPELDHAAETFGYIISDSLRAMRRW